MSDPEKPESKASEKEAEKPEPVQAEQEKTLEVSAGDFVRITPEALVDEETKEMTPIRLFRFGWPNKFQVVDVFIDAKHGQVLRLDPCCAWILDSEHHKKPVCQAHPSIYFEKITQEQASGAPDREDRYMGINIAGNDLLSVEYINGEREPRLLVKMVGQRPLMLSGEAARAMSRLLRARGVF
jgi:hypothetical protein